MNLISLTRSEEEFLESNSAAINKVPLDSSLEDGDAVQTSDYFPISVDITDTCDQIVAPCKDLRSIRSLHNVKTSNVTTLSLPMNHLLSLDGIELFPSLTSLDLSNNRLSERTVASSNFLSLANLTSLNFSGNQFSKLEGLQHLPKLEVLLVAFNKLRDLSFLILLMSAVGRSSRRPIINNGGVPNLRYFDAAVNDIRDLSTLQQLVPFLKLEEVRLYSSTAEGKMHNNPLCGCGDQASFALYQSTVLQFCPSLKVLDGKEVGYTPRRSSICSSKSNTNSLLTRPPTQQSNSKLPYVNSKRRAVHSAVPNFSTIPRAAPLQKCKTEQSANNALNIPEELISVDGGGHISPHCTSTTTAVASVQTEDACGQLNSVPQCTHPLQEEYESLVRMLREEIDALRAGIVELKDTNQNNMILYKNKLKAAVTQQQQAVECDVNEMEYRHNEQVRRIQRAYFVENDMLTNEVVALRSECQSLTLRNSELQKKLQEESHKMQMLDKEHKKEVTSLKREIGKLRDSAERMGKECHTTAVDIRDQHQQEFEKKVATIQYIAKEETRLRLQEQNAAYMRQYASIERFLSTFYGEILTLIASESDHRRKLEKDIICSIFEEYNKLNNVHVEEMQRINDYWHRKVQELNRKLPVTVAKCSVGIDTMTDITRRTASTDTYDFKTESNNNKTLISAESQTIMCTAHLKGTDVTDLILRKHLHEIAARNEDLESMLLQSNTDKQQLHSQLSEQLAVVASLTAQLYKQVPPTPVLNEDREAQYQRTIHNLKESIQHHDEQLAEMENDALSKIQSKRDRIEQLENEVEQLKLQNEMSLKNVMDDYGRNIEMLKKENTVALQQQELELKRELETSELQWRSQYDTLSQARVSQLMQLISNLREQLSILDIEYREALSKEEAMRNGLVPLLKTHIEELQSEIDRIRYENEKGKTMWQRQQQKIREALQDVTVQHDNVLNQQYAHNKL